MKKIMFNDKFVLTQAVLDGRKTMTRRIFYIPNKLVPYLDIDDIFDIVDDCILWKDKSDNIRMTFEPKYKVGEVVAIAQSYMDVDRFHRKGKNADYLEYLDSILPELKLYPGWGNKMFVKSGLMPHHIEITGIKVERLQDISDEDCLKEGIIKGKCGSESTHFMDAYYVPKENQPYCTPRNAFEVLINKVSGKGVWESNPFVFAYEFVLFD